MDEAQNSPLVSVKCLVYNHEPYLRDCLEGIVAQETSFPFECIVHDDASTDASAAIIREYAEKYPHIIKPVYQTENQYSKKDGSLGRAVTAAMSPSSRYVAFCEGDDYWCDPHKLQKQVDLLEQHPEYSMCCSQGYELVHSTGKKEKTLSYEQTELDWNTLILGNRILTLTTLLRRDLWAQYQSDFLPGMPYFGMGDYPMWLWMARQAPVYYFPEWMGVYRVLTESASHSKNPLRNYQFGLSSIEVAIFLCKEFGEPRQQLWRRRTRYVVKHCLKNRWFGTMFHDLLFPNVFRKKKK